MIKGIEGLETEVHACDFLLALYCGATYSKTIRVARPSAKPMQTLRTSKSLQNLSSTPITTGSDSSGGTHPYIRIQMSTPGQTIHSLTI